MTQFLFKRSGTADKRPDPLQMALGEVDLNYDSVTGGLFYKDSGGSVIKVGPAQVSATAPNATPAGSSGNALGEFWYDTGASALCIWDGSAWQATGGGGGGGGIPPSSFTAVGELLAGTGAGTYSALSVGGDASYLVADSTCAEGMKWAALPEASANAAGIVFGCYACGSVPYADSWDIAAFGKNAAGAAVTGAGAGSNFSTVTAIGNCAMATNNNNLTSVAVGTCAAYGGAGFGTVAIGAFAMVGGGSSASVAIGACASRALTGSNNVLLGNSVGACAASGSSNNVLIGTQGPFNGFGRASASSDDNVSIGFRAMCRMAQTATCNTNNNIAIGSCSMWQVSGGNNIAIGRDAACALTDGCDNIAIGYNVQLPSATGNCQLALGNGANMWLTGDSTFAIKPGAGIIDCAGSCGTAGQVLMSDGANAICWGSAGGGGIPTSAITGKGALITGTAASTVASLSVGSDGQVLVACGACCTGLVWAPNTAGTVSAATPTVQGIVYGKHDCGTAYPDTAWDYVGYGFCALNCSNQFNSYMAVTALGNFAGMCSAQTQATYVGYCTGACAGGGCSTHIGAFAGRCEAPTSGWNSTLGVAAGQAMCGQCNVAVGSNSGWYLCGNMNTFVGHNSGVYFGTQCASTVVSCNVAIGTNAGASMGAYTSSSATNNVLIGVCAGNSTGGNNNVAVGAGAGAGSNIGGSSNTTIGFRAAFGMGAFANNIVIGCCAGTATGGVSGALAASNRIVMGNSAHTCAQIQVAWTTTSDVRDKALDPAGVPYGLLFVEQLEPIAYRWCDRETNEVTDEKLRYGFSAQNVRSLEGDDPVIVSDDNPDKLMITDQHLLPVLVNAIKELSERNRLLEERITALEDKA